jgi:hypothetical protein
MTVSGGRLAAALWIGFGASIAGRLLDLQWHVTHDEFETAGDQVRAHWLAWLGAVVLLPHVLLAVTLIAMLVGAPLAALTLRRERHA